MPAKPKAIQRSGKRKPASLSGQDQLTELETAGLVRRLDESDVAYIFKHALTQESAYQSLLNRTRRDIHLRVASVYENLFSNRLDEYAAILAHHYAEGGDDEQALLYETRAGDVSTRLFANAEAIGHYTRALEIVAQVGRVGQVGATHESPLLKDLYLKRGRVFELQGRYDHALDNYDEMEMLARQRGDRAMELGALVSMATIHAIPSTAYDPQKAEQLANRALALARALSDSAAESRILCALMILNRWMGNFSDAVRFGEQSLAIARQNNLREQLAFTLNALVVHGYYNTGEFQRALAVSEQARQLWREMNNLPMLADNFGGSGIVNYSLGNFDVVIEDTSEALKISQATGNLWGQSYAQWIIGDVYSDRGEPDHAVQVMQNSIRIGKQANFAASQVGVRNALAITYGHYGLFARGIEIAEQSAATAETHFAGWAPWSYSVLARLFVRAGRIDQAEAAERRALAKTGQPQIIQSMGPILFQWTLAQAEIALAKNDLVHAATVLDALIDDLHQTGARAFLPEALFVRARVDMSSSQYDSALKTLAEARLVAESLVARRTLWQIYAALAEIETRLGNESAVQSLRQQSLEMIEYISAHANDELRAAFLNLPAVRAITTD